MACPYRVVEIREPDVTGVKVYRPQDGGIQVHQTRVILCPSAFPAGYYWYGDKRPRPGCPPEWVDRFLDEMCSGLQETNMSETSGTQDLSPGHKGSEECSPAARLMLYTLELDWNVDTSQSEPTAVRAPVHYGLRSGVKPPNRLSYPSLGQA